MYTEQTLEPILAENLHIMIIEERLGIVELATEAAHLYHTFYLGVDGNGVE